MISKALGIYIGLIFGCLILSIFLILSFGFEISLCVLLVINVVFALTRLIFNLVKKK